MTFSGNMANIKYGEIPKAPSLPNLHGQIQYGQEIGGENFSQTIASMIGKVNDVTSKPERLTMEAVTTGNVDIHEVMIAMGKSEVAFKLMTAIAQKGISTFDKLTNMQV